MQIKAQDPSANIVYLLLRNIQYVTLILFSFFGFLSLLLGGDSIVESSAVMIVFCVDSLKTVEVSNLEGRST